MVQECVKDKQTSVTPKFLDVQYNQANLILNIHSELRYFIESCLKWFSEDKRDFKGTKLNLKRAFETH